MKIYSIGFNYSLVTSKKKIAICLSKMTLEHSSVAYFNGGYIFVKLLDNTFSNIRSKSILLEINFIKENATYLDQK